MPKQARPVPQAGPRTESSEAEADAYFMEQMREAGVIALTITGEAKEQGAIGRAVQVLREVMGIAEVKEMIPEATEAMMSKLKEVRFNEKIKREWALLPLRQDQLGEVQQQLAEILPDEGATCR